MANLTDLPSELAEEVLCRIPVISSVSRIRSTCKKWNTLFKDGIFKKKHLAHAAQTKPKGEILAILLMNSELSMVSINLHDFDPSIKTIGNLTSLNDSDQLEINRVCHCDGLVLCVTEDYTSFVVWNPYTCETRRICAEPIQAHRSGSWYGHALGYDKSRTHKVLRFFLDLPENCLQEIYDVKSNTRRVLNVTPDWEVEDDTQGLSLKGNAYWYGQDKEEGGNVPGFLLCFDFTRERFVPPMPLPFESYFEDTVILSKFREDQLAVLLHRCTLHAMEIWVTTKIEPDAVSWSKFLAVDTHPLTKRRFPNFGSFIVDEEKKAVIVFDDDHKGCKKYSAFFIGENGYFRVVEIGVIMSASEKRRFPHSLSYVPSSVQINQPA